MDQREACAEQRVFLVLDDLGLEHDVLIVCTLLNDCTICLLDTLDMDWVTASSMVRSQLIEDRQASARLHSKDPML